MNLNTSPDSHVVAGATLRAAIRRRAEQIYIESGCIPGHDLDNWTRAEQEITALMNHARRTAVVILVNSVRFTGEYFPESSKGYVPGEFAPGASVPVRFEGEKMFVTRPNGEELETLIVQRTAT